MTTTQPSPRTLRRQRQYAADPAAKIRELDRQRARDQQRAAKTAKIEAPAAPDLRTTYLGKTPTERGDFLVRAIRELPPASRAQLLDLVDDRPQAAPAPAPHEAVSGFKAAVRRQFQSFGADGGSRYEDEKRWDPVKAAHFKVLVEASNLPAVTGMSAAEISDLISTTVQLSRAWDVNRPRPAAPPEPVKPRRRPRHSATSRA